VRRHGQAALDDLFQGMSAENEARASKIVV
jgi:hypothetical protein